MPARRPGVHEEPGCRATARLRGPAGVQGEGEEERARRSKAMALMSA